MEGGLFHFRNSAVEGKNSDYTGIIMRINNVTCWLAVKLPYLGKIYCGEKRIP